MAEVKTRLRHGLHPASQHQVSIPSANRHVTIHHRHHPRRAKHVQRISIHLGRNASLDGGVARQKLAVTVFVNIAHDVQIKVAARHLRPLQRRPHHVGSQIYRSHIF